MMKCYRHPERDAVAFCVVCGNPICDECRNVIGGRNFCTVCREEFPFDWFDFKFGFKDFGRAFKDFILAKVRCPKCHKPVREEFVVCPYCKTELKINCSKCGKSLRPEWVACPYCGQAKV